MIRAFIPVPPGEQEQADLPRALETILWTVMAASLLLFAAVPLLPQFAWRWLGIIAIVYALCVPLLVLRRRGRTRLASLLLLGGLWVLITVLVLTAGGLAAPSSFVYVIIVLIAGLLLGARAGIATALGCMLTALGLAIVEMTGHLPSAAIPYTPMSRLVSLTLFIAIALSLQLLSARTTGSALQRSQRELEDRKRAEEALRFSERRFSVAFNANPMLATISTLDGRFVAVNEQFLRTSGYTREEAVGHTAIELRMWFETGDRSRLVQALKDEGRVADFEAPLRTKSGDRRMLLLSVEAIELEGQACLLHSGQDITLRKRAEDALRTSQEQLRALSGRLESAREEEGARIAREIHDELGGSLTGLKWDLDRIDKILAEPGAGITIHAVRDRIPAMRSLIDSTIATVRRISSELHPAVLDDLGLIAAIEWQVQQFQSRTGIGCLYANVLKTAHLDRDRSTAVFRIFQEALTNVIRHAKATTIEIALQEAGGYLELEVKDNGRGITDDERGHARSLGLLGMQERALLVGGEVSIRGAAGHGTAVTVRVPLAA